MRFESLLLALMLTPWSPQDPAKQDPTPKPFALSDSALASAAAKQLDGAWQLLRVESPTLELFQGDTIGYALFREGYMSLEIHGTGLTDMADTFGLFFQTGFHRYTLDGTGGMETYSMIGVTNLTHYEDVEFQPPGERKRFKFSIQNDTLALEKPDGTRLTFIKLGKLPFPGAVEQVDAFGRPVQPPAEPKVEPPKTPDKKGG
ncbi:MAG: hypothetical protein K8S98_05785 [Planctomycetes bacterium]|nr:hypothetical protein [Planctomycetota bacterium]